MRYYDLIMWMHIKLYLRVNINKTPNILLAIHVKSQRDRNVRDLMIFVMLYFDFFPYKKGKGLQPYSQV